LTTGAGSTVLTQLNGSQFLAGLGLTAPATDGSITGQQLSSIDPVASASGGIGVHLQQSLNSLINPVDGLITNESNTLDDRISQYQSRISDLNAILASKKARLQEQFNNMETVLAKLQSQQSSLSQIKSVAA
ncbi:MAG: flagellar filament capping protein FliD, partial [Tepidisphaeraceae bacterium]